jgi:hypothetical protein
MAVSMMAINAAATDGAALNSTGFQSLRLFSTLADRLTA